MLGGKNKLDNVFRVNAVLPLQHPFLFYTGPSEQTGINRDKQLVSVPSCRG